ncbi:hypothetical protein [Tissierella praeacuta]|uniref:hypothetical protein n=1 Tax=Tissierella praeacuta TaxID=43131 RepID=UPI0028A7583C|nr:hypothetical protein [Tissierella praeacuta]
MMMNIKLSDEQCRKIAKKMLSGSFRMYGLGHFDIGVIELTEIMRIVFNEDNAEEKLEDYYEKIK